MKTIAEKYGKKKFKDLDGYGYIMWDGILYKTWSIEVDGGVEVVFADAGLEPMLFTDDMGYVSPLAESIDETIGFYVSEDESVINAIMEYNM